MSLIVRFFYPPLAPRAPLTLLAMLALHGLVGPAAAHTTTVEINGHYDNRVGSSDAASAGTIGPGLLRSRPVQRPGEVLELVPGVIVTQHSGDGKANQTFLRGFNLDHGTDFATSIAGMPVNMASHGHGQGYSDLNFLMPELVQRIDYRKGPYFAEQGDFASAGSADIRLVRRLESPLAQLSLGAHGYRRGVLAGSTELENGLTTLAAVEVMGNDGPWVNPERLQRRNGVFTLSGGSQAQGWQLSAMAYSARWNATDQVPQRLIDAGTFNGQPFGRFDAVDASDGGNTARYSLSGQWQTQGSDSATRVSAYTLRYQLQLWSNFTYALERPTQGDQFLQQDRRQVSGVHASHQWDHTLLGRPARSTLGLQVRHDAANVLLADSVARALVATTRQDDLRLTHAGVFGQTEWEANEHLRAVLGLRADQVQHAVQSRLLAANSGTARAVLLSPKLSVVAGPFGKEAHTEFFFNAGRGFHSNDARGGTITQDPKTGAPVNKAPVLVASQGTELGLRTQVVTGLQSSLALWRLNFNSELLFVGDAGATQASAASRRHGVEFNNRWQVNPNVLLDADLAWSHARFANGARIPNAVGRVASLAATLDHFGPWRASLQWRYLGAGALTQDNSVRSQPSLTANLRVALDLTALLQGAAKPGTGSELTLDVFNLSNRRANDIQYVYESQLPGESAPVADRHVHPAQPRNVRLTLRWVF